MLHIQKFVFYLFQENTFVLWDDTLRCAIVDPGCERTGEREQLHAFIAEKGLTPELILLTHAHLDHIFGAREFADRYGVPVLMSPKEEKTIEIFNANFVKMGLHCPQSFDYQPVEDGDTITFGNTTAKVLATPGHSLGGVCYLIESEKVIFTGDTLFAGSIGRTDNECASLEELQASLQNVLMTLDGDIDVYPGHGPKTSIAVERTTNPFIYPDRGIWQI